VTVHPIHALGDPLLRTSLQPVTEFDARLRRLVDDMFETMYAANGAGLAANQVGVDARVFVYDCGPDEDGRPRRGSLVNPVLSIGPEGREYGVAAPDPDGPDPEDPVRTATEPEGCLSVPGVSYPTTRWHRVSATGQDLDGRPVRVEAVDYLARCLQHETDHLNGVVYLDRLTGEHRRAARRALREQASGRA
jgi:peptide deformylase